jgi:transposase
MQYFVRKPLLKRWKGQDGKITHEELCEVLKDWGIVFNRKRSNQEERDALLLACVLADFEYRI